MSGGADRRVRVLLAGPLPIDGDVVGGTKVSFARLARGLGEDERLDVRVLDTSRARRGRGRARRLVGELGALARLLGRTAFGRHDVVVLNASSGGLLWSGPLVWAACRLRGARLVVRVFGGDLDLFLERAPRLRRALFHGTTARADLLLLQTRALCERLGGAGNVRWLPTTREPGAQLASRRGAAERDRSGTRFLFVGQLRAEKGVADAVAAANVLGPGATLTVAGPAMPGLDVEALESTPRWSWVGPLPPEEVPLAMADHDALIFPSRHAGEGLPGTIVEAMQLGLPVVAARWRSVPELVEDDVNGLLVAPGDADGLAAAMRRLAEDPALLERLARGAVATGQRYRAARWERELGGWISVLACGERRTQERRTEPEAQPAPSPRAGFDGAE